MKSCQLHDVTSCIMSKEKATEKGLEKKKKQLKDEELSHFDDVLCFCPSSLSSSLWFLMLFLIMTTPFDLFPTFPCFIKLGNLASISYMKLLKFMLFLAAKKILYLF